MYDLLHEYPILLDSFYFLKKLRSTYMLHLPLNLRMKKLLHNMVCSVNHIWSRESAKCIFTRDWIRHKTFLYWTFTSIQVYIQFETLNSCFLSHEIRKPSDGKPAEGSQSPSLPGPHTCLHLSYDWGHFALSPCLALITNKIPFSIQIQDISCKNLANFFICLACSGRLPLLGAWDKHKGTQVYKITI